MDLKRLFRDRKFYLAVLLSFLGILAGTAWAGSLGAKTLAAGTFLSLPAWALRSRTVLFLLPLTSVIPYGDEYLRERRGRFQRFLLARRGRREYCMDKLLTTALSGALVWLFAIFFAVLFFFLLFFAREQVWSGQIEPIRALWFVSRMTSKFRM